MRPGSAALIRVIDAVTELAMVSHANASSYEGFTRSGGEDSKKPGGGTDSKGDKTPEFRQKSAEYFWRRLFEVRTVEELENLAAAAEEAVAAWRKTPEVAGVDPSAQTFRWKCRIADDADGTVEEIARRYSVSTRTVIRYRAQYRGVLRPQGRLS